MTRAFGPEAKLYESEFTVIAKGLPANLLYSTADALLLQEIKVVVPETIRCKLECRRDPVVRYTTCIIYLCNIDVAERLCERGLVWQAQIFNCEPFSVELRFSYCFKCYKFGHKARYCKAKARCRYYTGVVYPEGEERCP